MLSGKNIRRVSLARMRRAFVGIYDAKDKVEKWIECGHFVQGVQLTAEEIIEVDGDGNAAERIDAWKIAGSAQPSQNTIDDYEFYDTYLAGKQSFAFWCDNDQLWFFKIYNMGHGVIYDNRISIFPKQGYESPRQSETVRFDGLIKGFEIVKLKPHSPISAGLPIGKDGAGRLRYTALQTLKYGNIRNFRVPPDGIVGFGSGNTVKIIGSSRTVPNQKISKHNAIDLG